MQVWVTVGEESYFKIGNQLAHLLLVQSILGTATMVAKSTGMLLLKSSLGSGCGPKIKVTALLTKSRHLA